MDKKDTEGVNPGKYDGLDNCAELPFLSLPSVQYNLKVRYSVDIFHNFCGVSCVTINPYRYYPVYHEEAMKRFIGRSSSEAPAHVYVVADQAFRYLLATGKSQSIIST